MNEPLLQKLTAALLRGQYTVTTAESCTGGLLAAELTRRSGSSAWFETGFVTYSNAAKQKLLGVRDKTLATYGAVSEKTVGEMAAGARYAAGADYALAISGIAGPSGGSADKPVGTVCFGLATKDAVFTGQKHFTGDRDAVRAQAVTHALTWLAEKLAT